uniref:Peptidase S9 prolyl oligopeptidase catalytic domain-containing protein n=1 Tax=Setaria italica TaxID=4555 RepID=K3Y2D8_SETIT
MARRSGGRVGGGGAAGKLEASWGPAGGLDAEEPAGAGMAYLTGVRRGGAGGELGELGVKKRRILLSAWMKARAGASGSGGVEGGRQRWAPPPMDREAADPAGGRVAGKGGRQRWAPPEKGGGGGGLGEEGKRTVTSGRVVPPDQARKIYKALKEKGLPVALVEYEGEQHGLRKVAENIKFTLEQQMVFFARLVGKFEVADDITPIKIENFD